MAYSLLLLFLGTTLTIAQDCTLSLPQNPLTATGLATPFSLGPSCNQTDFANQGCFVEAAIFDPAKGSFSIYHPLVVNQGSTEGVDFIKPVAVTLPDNAIVGLWFGTNGNSITLAGDATGCVNGDNGSKFGQFAYCNAPAVFTAAQKAIASGQLTIPAPGTATKAAGQACPAGARDFRIIDMDQSDNVVTTYLLINGQKLAQNTPQNAKNNPNAEELTNNSDNGLINAFLQPTMGCTTFTVPSLTAPGGSTSALVLNELVSQVHPGNPPAFVPVNDPMATVNNQPNLEKVNLYRDGVGQPQASSVADAAAAAYCQQYAASGLFIAQNQQLFTNAGTPAANMGSNLFTFMAQRFGNSFAASPALGCTTIFGLNTNPVAMAAAVADGPIVSATINTAVLSKILSGAIKAVATGT